MGQPQVTLAKASGDQRRVREASSTSSLCSSWRLRRLMRNGHINLSPKGLDTFRILGPRTVAYLDIIGSGVETIAHLRENGRIVLMFCAFQGSTEGLCGCTGRAAWSNHTRRSSPHCKLTFPSMKVRVRSSWSRSRASATRAATASRLSSTKGSERSCRLGPKTRDRRLEDLPAGEEPPEYRRIAGRIGVSAWLEGRKFSDEAVSMKIAFSSLT